MARIHQLSKHLINQIAAGEVIERPASVVKELCENSVDAGADRISIEITNDCRDIRIADNGCGIHPEDIMLAFSKHATSKISTDEDLYSICTLGFRGEALSSIISISKLSCTTRTADFQTGTKVVCENSEVKQFETGCAVGTIMDVKNLFYNLPVRLKFLRNPNTEFSYIQEIVQSLAIINNKVAFDLKKNGKTVLKTTGQGSLAQVVKEIYSIDTSDSFRIVDKNDDFSNIKVSGIVSTPDFTRTSKKNYHLYINSRSVKCPILQKAIDNAYKTLIASGKYPFVILNLELSPQDVDVNVHPTKKEVRYKNPNQIFNFVRTAIEAGLLNYSFNKNLDTNSDIESDNVEVIASKDTLFDNNVVHFDSVKNHVQFDIDSKNDTIYVSDDTMINFQNKLDRKYNDVVQQKFIANNFSNTVEPEDKIIGQYKNTYILIERDDGLEIVDQHIAQERFIYEKLKSQKEVASQILFISDVIEVNPSEIELIKNNLLKFENFGYGIEILNDKEIIFKKVPVMLSKVDPKEILSDIFENIDGNIDGLEEKILITTSCKASVKAGEKLSLWQMQEIIKNWRTTKMPYTCPHGRPVSHIIKHKDLAAFFERQK